jgi:hypothetical protein
MSKNRESNEVVNQITAEYVKGLQDRYNMFYNAVKLYEETPNVDLQFDHYLTCKEAVAELKKEIDYYNGKY